MRLDPDDGPIQMGILAAGLANTLIELRYESPPRYSLPFDPSKPPAVLEQYIEIFQGFVTADEGWESESRRGLSFLLNLNDSSLLKYYRKLEISYPVGDPKEIRYFLLILWEHTFAHWQDRQFVEEDYELHWS